MYVYQNISFVHVNSKIVYSICYIHTKKPYQPYIEVLNTLAGDLVRNFPAHAVLCICEYVGYKCHTNGITKQNKIKRVAISLELIAEGIKAASPSMVIYGWNNTMYLWLEV
jgi:hypothetical protein